MSNLRRPDQGIPAQSRQESPPARTVLWAGVVLFVLVLAAFLPTLSNGFVGYDDPEYVSENDHVRAGLTWEGIQWAFRSSEAANWHPLTRLSHMLDCQLFGLAPRGHHLTSILLHALTVSLLFAVFRRMTGATWRSVAVALLFGVHPLRVESVAWISERKDVLSALFWMLTLWAYARYAEGDSPQSTVHSPRTKAPRASHQASRFTFHFSRFYLLSLFFFACGLMSKPMMVSLPCVLLLLDYWPLRRFQGIEAGVAHSAGGAPPHATRNTHHVSRFTPQSPIHLLAEKLPFFLAAAAFSAVTYAVQQHAGAVYAGSPLSERLANAVVSYGRYFGKLFWPAGLAAFYPGEEHWAATTVLAATALLLVISAAAIALWRARAYGLVGWLWFLGTLVPVIGIVQVGSAAMADRYSYLPSIGILLIVVWGAYDLTRSWRQQAFVAWVATAAAALACAGLTARQATYWKDTESLFRHALQVTRDNYGPHHVLGMALDRQGRIQEAMEEYRATIRAKGDYYLAYNNLGVDLAKQGHPDQAVAQFQAALKINPSYADPYNNLGTLLETQGRFDEALQQFQTAVRLKPDFADAHYNLGVALGRKGLFDQAAQEFQRVIELKPGYAEAYNNLGVMLERTGRLEEAMRQYMKAVELNPAYPSAHFNLGVALARQGHLPEAISAFREALRLKPDYAAAQTNLAVAQAALQGPQRQGPGPRSP